jgi:hypothetical protein
VIEPTATLTDTPAVEPTPEDETIEYEVGPTTYRVVPPEGFFSSTEIAESIELYELPSFAFAPDQITLEQYLREPERVTEPVITFAAFTTEDLPEDLLPDPTADEILAPVLPPESLPSEELEAEDTGIEDGTVHQVVVLDEETGQLDVFRLVTYPNPSGITDYLLVQASLLQEDWEAFEPVFEEMFATLEHEREEA